MPLKRRYGPAASAGASAPRPGALSRLSGDDRRFLVNDTLRRQADRHRRADPRLALQVKRTAVQFHE